MSRKGLRVYCDFPGDIGFKQKAFHAVPNNAAQRSFQQAIMTNHGNDCHVCDDKCFGVGRNHQLAIIAVAFAPCGNCGRCCLGSSDCYHADVSSVLYACCLSFPGRDFQNCCSNVAAALVPNSSS